MTLEEYKKAIKEIEKSAKKAIEEIEKSAKKAKDRVAREYTLLNSNVKISDMITDHIGTIKVEVIEWCYSMFDYKPSCVYYGPCYTKKGTPYKSGEKRNVYQHHIRRDEE